jgi:hypothetical protein
MALEIVTGTPGLWRETGWAKDLPGVYALVVGVSAYPYLEGGTTPALETYELGQLLSSASTAAKIFTWLKTSFRRENLPVVWCYLLLSPTGEERQRFDAGGLTHYATPDYETLRRAIQAWTGSVPKQPPASRRSRTLFFFSGHGVQANRKAVLLPSDYLNTSLGEPDVENCIGVDDLREWMEESPVAEHVALLDACRNEFSPLASKGATAHGIFPTNPPTGAAPLTAATLAATSPNSVAYQFPGHAYTFFGQAVLEALGGFAGRDRSRLDFRQLVDYVKPRVNMLLKDATRDALDQTVRQRIEGDSDLVVTEITSAALSLIGPAEPVIEPSPLESVMRGGPRGMQPMATSDAVQEALRERFDEAFVVREAIPLVALAGSWDEAHRRFGHEYASMLWFANHPGLYSLENGQPCLDGATILRVRRNDKSSIVEVDLALNARRGGVLLVFDDVVHVRRERLAVALPTDMGGQVPVRLTLVSQQRASDPWPMVETLEARLGPCEWNPHYDYLWSLAREADLGSLRKAAERADPERLKLAARDKQQSETAATAGMLLLARVGGIAKVDDWTRNLMQWFPWIPDGTVLWAESLRSALARGESTAYGVAAPVEQMCDALEALPTRGVPFFAETLDLAYSLVRYLRRAQLGEARRERLERVAQWIDRALEATVPGGHFLVVSGLPRPADEAGGSGALTVAEILDLIRGRSA